MISIVAITMFLFLLLLFSFFVVQIFLKRFEVFSLFAKKVLLSLLFILVFIIFLGAFVYYKNMGFGFLDRTHFFEFILPLYE